jgi:hypothetical protein
MDTNRVIEEAEAYIDKFERSNRFLDRWFPWVCLLVAVICAGEFLYLHFNYSEKVKYLHEKVEQKLAQQHFTDEQKELINQKIILEKVDKKLNDPSGIGIATAILLSWIVIFATAKSRQRNIKTLRELVRIAQENIPKK